ncbi:Bud-site selection protein [Decorospora gaudefroyi]|uniref:Bud-site selection protein n=1 Tax=Decorospora gaudefroyi TaxID=184978 RepID=A0A6A5KHG7_9PLEO|nr:Bud-site selection protein [Decorospora gaudefroyi]
MPKRKRASSLRADIQSNTTAPPARQAKYCAERLATAHKALLTALRHGATLERQKHSRRKKVASAKKDNKGLERVAAEYTVLKALNLEQLADQHLRKTVARVKSLKDAEPLQEYIAGIRAASHDTNMLNVTARLFKVPQVKEVVDGLVGDLKTILGAGGDGGKRDGKKNKVAEKEDEDMQQADDDENEDDPYMAFSARIAAPSSGEGESEDSVSDNERPPSIGDSESEHDPDDDLEAGDTSSGEEDTASDDEGDIHSQRRQPVRSIAPPSDDDSAFDSDLESDSDQVSIPTAKTKLPATDTKPTTSAFLPALSHAAYFSGSESEASDLDADIEPRKNRRGQRARQKIAEAKFGAKAKHLEKVQKKAGWDAKRGAVGDKRERNARKTGGRGPEQSGGNAEPLGDKKGEKKAGAKRERDDKGDLHPSWLAAKKAKESKKLKIEVGKTQGRKVVFD